MTENHIVDSRRREKDDSDESVLHKEQEGGEKRNEARKQPFNPSNVHNVQDKDALLMCILTF